MDLHKKINSIKVEVHAKKIPELKQKETNLKDRISNLNITNINLDWI